MFSPFIFVIAPESSCSIPAIIFNNVDFPAPFTPIIPTLSSDVMVSFTSVNNGFSL